MWPALCAFLTLVRKSEIGSFTIPSHVLRAMGVPFTAAHGSIRFSLSGYNTEAEVDRVLEVVPGIIAELRELSPFWADLNR